jgi:hypothetical protein
MAKIGKAIAYQINQIDAQAFGRWNAKDLVMLEADEDRKGGIVMRVKSPAFKGLGYLEISLRENDKYKIEVYKIRNLTKKLKDKLLEGDFEMDDLRKIIGVWDYTTSDDLVQNIDELLKVD